MFHKVKKTTVVFISILTAAQSVMAFAERFDPPIQETSMFEVTIENLTEAQPLTPPVITFGKKVLYRIGEPSSVPLAELAEDGVQKGFKVFGGEKLVLGSSLILPGQKETFVVEGGFEGSVTSRAGLSIVSMLARTNDAFIGLDRVFPFKGFGGELISVGQSRAFFAQVYDSGTEENTESCEHVPAPPCDNHFARAAQNAEGIVQLHPGLNLQGDLTEKDQFDVNKGAQITIKRIR